MNYNFLSKIKIANYQNEQQFPFNLSFLKEGYFELNVDSPITILVGDNGIGKSTLLESLAYNIGFNVLGGGRNHYYNGTINDNLKLSEYMKLVWHEKTSRGFFMRAESFVNFSSYLDNLAYDDSSIYNAYGGKSLNCLSHGQAFLSLFENRFRDGIFILDEPEAALAPSKILSLISIIKRMLDKGRSQFIIATHSPILMTYPNALLYLIDESGINKTSYEMTDHYQVTKSFLQNPEKYYRILFDQK